MTILVKVGSKVPPLLSVDPSGRDTVMRVTCRIDFSTPTKDID